MLRMLKPLVVAALFTVGIAGADAPSTNWKETMLEGEHDIFARAALAVNGLQRNAARKQDGTVRRGFHAKQVTGAAAVLKVMPDLPAHARHGIFREPKTYQAWARFSNGDPAIRLDQRPDQHGLAVKVLAPGGEQDFLLTNNPVFLLRDARQFLAVVGIMLGEARVFETLVKHIGVKEATRIAGRLKRHAMPLRSAAEESYWSGAAIKMGPYAAKLMLRPVSGDNGSKGFFTSKNYLREDLDKRLSKGGIRFDLMAQFFVDEQKTPIEDATVPWKESDAPFVKLAELTVTGRQAGSQQALQDDATVEKLSFSPWHGSEELRPLGNIMRLRRVAYEASARLRGAQ